MAVTQTTIVTEIKMATPSIQPVDCGAVGGGVPTDVRREGGGPSRHPAPPVSGSTQQPALVGEKKIAPGGGGGGHGGPLFKPPPPLLDCRAGRGGSARGVPYCAGGGGGRPQHIWLKNDPQVAPIILTTHMRGENFLVEKTFSGQNFVFRRLWPQYPFLPRGGGDPSVLDANYPPN